MGFEGGVGFSQSLEAMRANLCVHTLGGSQSNAGSNIGNT